MLKTKVCPDKEENKTMTHSIKKKLNKVRKEKEGKIALLSWASTRLYNASDGIYFPC